MITRVQVKNFRSIASADVSLGPLTVLVGRNGAGKSAFVDVLRFVRDAMERSLTYAFFAANRRGIELIRRWSPNKPYDLEIELTFELPDGVQAAYGFVIGSDQKNSYKVKREFFRDTGENKQNDSGNFEVRNGKRHKDETPNSVLSGLQLDETELTFPKTLSYSRTFISLWWAMQGEFYSIFSNTLRLPQTLSSQEELTEDGSNLAPVLYAMQKDGNYFPDLRSALRRVVDGVRDVQVKEALGYLFIQLLHGDLTSESEEATKAPWLNLEQESDGTIRMLAMLTALYQQGSKSKRLLTLEEPENSLHPGALAVLADIISEASLRRQVIITTQSPDLISRFNADELRVVQKVNGSTQIGPLDSIQRQAVVDELFSAGDLLRIEGLRIEPDEAEIK